MIGLRAGTRVWLAAGVTDMRCGIDSLAARVHGVLSEDPYSGHVFAFRGRRGDLIKVLWSDGDGMCLLTKRLERRRFVWPQAESGSISLSSAQLAMLLAGIDWRRPERTRQLAPEGQDREGRGSRDSDRAGRMHRRRKRLST